MPLSLSARRKFLSTPSARRATGISSPSATVPLYFYPRPPRGGRRQRRYQRAEHREFLSTPSARRATQNCRTAGRARQISIHALREEGDHAGINTERLSWIFLSTPSARRATK